MAINLPNFLNAPLQGHPAANIFEDVLKGYQMQQEPAKMAREAKQQELANQLKQLEYEHKPKEYKLNDKQMELVNSLKSKALEHYEEKFNLEKQVKQSQIDKNNRPAELKDALAKTFKLRDSLDPQSPTYTQDLADVNNRIKKLSNPSKGIQVSQSPEGGLEISVGGQAAKTEGLSPLPKGQVYIFDENKNPIGIGKPYSEGEKKEYGGRAAFNIYQKFITDAQAPYSGEGSNEQFENDVSNYSTDPEAKQRIDNLLAADKLLFSATVKEEATLGGANTNQAYNRIAHSLQNSEIYPLLKNSAPYRLPKGYAKFSSDIFRNKLNEGSEAAADIPPYKIYYNKPNANNSPTSQKTEPPRVVSSANGFSIIKDGDKFRRIPTSKVDKYMIAHTKPEYGVQNVE